MTELETAPRVAGVTPLRPYVVRVMFADGRVRDVDIEPMLPYGVFRQLRDPKRFAAVSVYEGGITIYWPGDPHEIDLDPEVLYGLEEAADDGLPGARMRTVA